MRTRYPNRIEPDRCKICNGKAKIKSEAIVQTTERMYAVYCPKCKIFLSHIDRDYIVGEWNKYTLEQWTAFLEQATRYEAADGRKETLDRAKRGLQPKPKWLLNPFKRRNTKLP